jgi:D-alanine--poly(phosphoribitol) ligase subunit 2
METSVEDEAAMRVSDAGTRIKKDLTGMSTQEIVLNELTKISEIEEVRQNLDLELFDEGVLDSFGMVELIVALGEIFHLDISPAQVDREMWATPRKIIADIETRLER